VHFAGDDLEGFTVEGEVAAFDGEGVGGGEGQSGDGEKEEEAREHAEFVFLVVRDRVRHGAGMGCAGERKK
jgi:hypothetical protein